MVILFGLPAKFVADFGGVDGIAEVMTGTVGDKGDQGFGGRRTDVRGQGRGCFTLNGDAALQQKFIQNAAEHADEVDVL